MEPHRSPRAAARARRRLAIGRLGEQAAAEHLRRRGFEILARNVRTAAGEIDLVAAGAQAIVFVEVKTTTRRDGAGEDRGRWLQRALERVGPHQRRRLRSLALDWLREQRPAPRRGPAAEIRFDAVGVVLDPAGRLLALEHLEAAF